MSYGIPYGIPFSYVLKVISRRVERSFVIVTACYNEARL
jgi:hypothetical protein